MKNNKLKPLKIITFLCLVLVISSGYAQSLSINFENSDHTLIDYDDGGYGSIVDNPFRSGANLSSKIAKIIRTTGNLLEDNDAWAGSKLVLDDKLNFEELKFITMKIYTSAPEGTKLTLKLENGTGPFQQVDAYTRISNDWQTVQWDFTGTPSDFNELVFMFDRDNFGDGSEKSTFYFDDIRHVAKKFQLQIDLPVTFDESRYDYTMVSFEGLGVAIRTNDPDNANNKVIKVKKPVGAGEYAGLHIGTREGFASTIPLSMSNSRMSVRIYAPFPGIPINLKVENSDNPTLSCETMKVTTTQGWQTLIFDFKDERTGTQPLEDALRNGLKANLAALFFDFGNPGRDEVYYFDDVKFLD